MTLPIYRNLSAKDLDDIITFAVDCDFYAFVGDDPDSEISKRCERIYQAANEILEELESTDQ